MAVDVIPRAITERVREALADTPVVVINGARQVGKSTLVRGLSYPGSAEVVTFDDPLVRAAAQRDPRGFLQRDVGTLVIDEAQLVPEIFRVVKAEVDLDRRPGRFILTGSSRLLAAPDMADSLVGRVEVLELSPFTQAELDRTAERFIDTVFDSPRDLIRQGSVDRSEIIARVCRGGFPDAHARSDARRSRWFDSYVITTVERVVRELAELARLAEIPRLLQVCAARTAQEVNVASISGELGIPVRTVSGYVARLETAFLLQLVPAWSTNLSAKVVRKPKLVVIDSGLAAHLIGATPAQITRQPDLFGPLLETFVCGEIRRQLTWSRTRASMSHFRDRSGAEVDILLEASNGDIVGIEVKATSSPSSSDFKGLAFLSGRLGERFRVGIVLCLAPTAVPMGPKLMALPVNALWQPPRAPSVLV